MRIDNTKDDVEALSLEEYTEIVMEIDNQPRWRSKADKEMDYKAGNQLDSELLKKLESVGIPPAVENIIEPTINAVCGMEAKTRTDWRVTPDGDVEGQDVADALNYKLNQAERHSKADRACSAAFNVQFAVGLGWVEVAREKDPFKFPYRCSPVHRNEIFWDWTAEEVDLTDARWLRRQRWIGIKRALQAFPAAKDKFSQSNGAWFGVWSMGDGGTSTGLTDSWTSARGQTIEEQRWWNPLNNEVCINEVWYRRWVEITALTLPNGRVIEYDEDNPQHNVAIMAGGAEISRVTVARVRQSYWLGPHLLHDGPSPYSHRFFGYVPFWGWREDRTKVPYGAIRHMIFPQDTLNSAIAKLRWGMSAMRTERTEGAVAMRDEQFRAVVARPDADIILDAAHMAMPGARFDVKRDYTLTEQHYKLMSDSRASIERLGVTASFLGQQGTATSGLQEQTQVEQATQSMAALMDNFNAGRTNVGEILLSFIIDDLTGKEQEIVIEGDAVRPERRVIVNAVEVDDMTGQQYLRNDVSRTMLKVVLEDVPTTSSFRAQQLSAMSEAVKSMTPQMQQAVMPFMVSLMDLPFKREVVEAIREATKQETPEQVEQRIKDAVAQALKDSGNEIKSREVAIKESESDARIRKLIAETVQTGVQSAFSAMQAGQVIATMPQVAPVADAVMQGAGYQRPNPIGVDPNFPQPQVAGVPAPDVRQNTSPEFPPVPQRAGTGMQGIETPRTSDNMVQ